MPEEIPKKIEISHRTVIFAVLFIAAVLFVYFIRDVIVQIFAALVIMTILNPTVTRLQKFKIPRALSILIVYIIVFMFIGFAIAQIVPAVVEQTQRFLEVFTTSYLGEVYIPEEIAEQIRIEINNRIGDLTSQGVQIGVSLLGNVLTVITVLIFALYFLLARDKLDDHLGLLLRDAKKQKRIEKVIDTLEHKLGGWARAEIVLMLMVGVTTYIGLVILGIPFALPLAVIAGLLELVPTIGPILAAVPAVIVGLGISPLTALAVAALAFLIQQVEAYVFVPKIMQKSAGVNPIVTLLALVVGLKVAGIVGALLSVPVVITAQVLMDEYVFNRE